MPAISSGCMLVAAAENARAAAGYEGCLQKSSLRSSLSNNRIDLHEQRQQDLAGWRGSLMRAEPRQLRDQLGACLLYPSSQLSKRRLHV